MYLFLSGVGKRIALVSFLILSITKVQGEV